MPTPKGTKPWNFGKGRGWIDKKGYRWVYVSEAGRRRARREHRAVMEEHLGRKLEPWELVHHKDGDRLNNDLSNLEIREFGEHTAEHHTGAVRDAATCRTVEAFARMREALKEERRIRAALYEALESVTSLLQDERDILHESVTTPSGAYTDEQDAAQVAAMDAVLSVARAALAAARGEAS